MSSSIVDGTQIDTSVFSYTSPKPHASGGKVINLFNRNFKESLTISTPLMLTWGAQEGKDTLKNPTGKWSLSLQFPSEEYSTEDQEQFLVSMKALESKIKEDAITNSKLWFGKEIKSLEVIEEKFNPMLKYPKMSPTSSEYNYSKPPTLTVKLPQWKTGWKSEIYNEDGEPLFIPNKVNADNSPVEYLQPKSRVMCLIQCGGLWYVNGKISITWNLQQAVVKSPKPVVEGVCFLKPKPEDREALKTMPHPEDVELETHDSVAISTTVVDSDEEGEDDSKIDASELEPVQPEPTQPVVQQVPQPQVVKKGRKPTGK